MGADENGSSGIVKSDSPAFNRASLKIRVNKVDYDSNIVPSYTDQQIIKDEFSPEQPQYKYFHQSHARKV